MRASSPPHRAQAALVNPAVPALAHPPQQPLAQQMLFPSFINPNPNFNSAAVAAAAQSLALHGHVQARPMPRISIEVIPGAHPGWAPRIRRHIIPREEPLPFADVE